jgi:dihydroorotate dehydrogenase
VLKKAAKSKRNKFPFLLRIRRSQSRQYRHFFHDAPAMDLSVDFGKFSWPGPLGLAAGLDKNGLAPIFWAALGFHAVEIGTITPEAQPGNPIPRLFRLKADGALINRLGFNNAGMAEVWRNLSFLRGEKNRQPFFSLGINLGKNKEVTLEDAYQDYVRGAEKFASFADYITINISSPNTPFLRKLHEKAYLQKLLSQLQKSRLGKNISFFLKLAPDFETPAILESVQIALKNNFAGIIMGNTTLQRPELKTTDEFLLAEQGGLSGLPLRRINLEKVKEIHGKYPNLPIIGVGGISSFQDLKKYLLAGARAVQLYTGLIYQGPALPELLIRDLVKDMKLNKTNNFMEYLQLIRKNH